MLSKNKKFLLILAGLLVLTGVLIFLVYWQQDGDELEVIFLDIGQGDSILIRTPDEQDILIDGGPDKTVVQKLGRYLPFFDRDIELMILTHPHADHVDGLIDVLKRYKVEQILHTNVSYPAADYAEWLRLVEEKNIETKIALRGQTYHLGEGTDLYILFPFEDLTDQEFKDLNAASIVAKLVHEDVSFLLTGDATKEVEEQLLVQEEEGLDFPPVGLKSDVLKVGHHGSKYSSSQEFLGVVDPTQAVIQCGQDNKFGHPHAETLESLEELGIEILRNDQMGDVRMMSDGEGVEVTKHQITNSK